MALSILLSDDEVTDLKELLAFQRRGFESSKIMYPDMEPPHAFAVRFTHFASIERKLGVDVTEIPLQMPALSLPLPDGVPGTQDVVREQLEMSKKLSRDIPTRLERISSAIFARIVADCYRFSDDSKVPCKEIAINSVNAAKYLVAELDNESS